MFLEHWGVQHVMVISIYDIHIWSLFTYYHWLSFIRIVIYEYIICHPRTHTQRLYCDTVHMILTLNPQMYLWNSGTQGITADTPSGTSIKEMRMDYDGEWSLIMIYQKWANGQGNIGSQTNMRCVRIVESSASWWVWAEWKLFDISNFTEMNIHINRMKLNFTCCHEINTLDLSIMTMRKK